MKKASTGSLQAAGVLGNQSRTGQRPRDPGDGTASCTHRVPGSRVVMSIGVHSPVTHSLHNPLNTGDVESSFVGGIIVCRFNGAGCWDCNPSIASQGEITLKVESAENSQVTCNFICYGNGERSLDISRLEGDFCYEQTQISEVFCFRSLMQYWLLVFNDDTFMTTRQNETCLDSLYWKYGNSESII